MPVPADGADARSSPPATTPVDICARTDPRAGRRRRPRVLHQQPAAGADAGDAAGDPRPRRRRVARPSRSSQTRGSCRRREPADRPVSHSWAMGTKVFMNVRGFRSRSRCCHSLLPAVAAGQDTGIGVSVQGAAGSHIGDGGDTQSLGLGVWFGERFGVVVNAERSHVPTDVTFYDRRLCGDPRRHHQVRQRRVPLRASHLQRLSPYVHRRHRPRRVAPERQRVLPRPRDAHGHARVPRLWRPRAA